MARVRIYTDENVNPAVADGLRRRGVDAWSASEAGKLGLSDEDQLRYATQEHAVSFTHGADLISIGRAWTQQVRNTVHLIGHELHSSPQPYRGVLLLP